MEVVGKENNIQIHTNTYLLSNKYVKCVKTKVKQFK